jgi:leucyl-tRNA synthetase
LLNECYYREDEAGKKRWFYPSEVEINFDEKGKPMSAKALEDGLPVIQGGIEKMSKSKNNVVEPRDVIEKYGADTARFFIMFAGPPDQSAVYSESGIEGAHRFLKRLWNFVFQQRAWLGGDAVDLQPKVPGDLPDTHKALRRQMHLLLQQADYDFGRMQYNTVVSACMKMLNAMEDAKLSNEGAHAASSKIVMQEAMAILIRVLYPVAPHACHGLWVGLGFSAKQDLLDAPWPLVDATALKQDTIELVLQVNGKVRGSLSVAAQADKASIEALARAHEAVGKFSEGNPVKKVIVVPGRLVNVVV